MQIQSKILKTSEEEFFKEPYLYKTLHMPREKTKIFWRIPNEYLNYLIENFELKKYEKEPIKATFIKLYLF